MAATEGKQASSIISDLSRLARSLTLSQKEVTSPNYVNLSGVDHLTTLPTELFEDITSYLDPQSILALRSTSRDTAEKSTRAFNKIRFPTLTVTASKIGVKRAQKELALVPGSYEFTKEATFVASAQTERHQRGNRGTSTINLLKEPDVKALLACIPNVLILSIRDELEGGCATNFTPALVRALTGATPPHLTSLTLEGITLPGAMLKTLLNAHSSTLRSLRLEYIIMDMSEYGPMFKTLRDDMALEHLGLCEILVAVMEGAGGKVKKIN